MLNVSVYKGSSLNHYIIFAFTGFDLLLTNEHRRQLPLGPRPASLFTGEDAEIQNLVNDWAFIVKSGTYAYRKKK